jgi:hypothetical protein
LAQYRQSCEGSSTLNITELDYQQRQYHLDITNETMSPDGFAKQVMVVNGQIPGPVSHRPFGILNRMLNASDSRCRLGRYLRDYSDKSSDYQRNWNSLARYEATWNKRDGRCERSYGMPHCTRRDKVVSLPGDAIRYHGKYMLRWLACVVSDCCSGIIRITRFNTVTVSGEL